MKRPHCKEEIAKDLYDDTSGAVFIALDSSGVGAWVWPAIWGIRKYEGCVEFGRGFDRQPFNDGCDESIINWMSDAECNVVYYRKKPKAGEAWLVKPLKDGYEWERVDKQIVFTN